MGMDEVYAHIGEKYYLSGEADWADSSFLANLSDRIKKIKPNFVGNKAPNLQMQDYRGQWVNLHTIQAKYIIIVFWDTDCGHCKKEVPALHDIYKKYVDSGLEIFAVYTQGDKEKWAKFVNEHNLDWINVYDPYHMTNFRDLYDIYSTPVVYLLDKDKTILAKRIAVEDVDDFLGKMMNK